MAITGLASTIAVTRRLRKRCQLGVVRLWTCFRGELLAVPGQRCGVAGLFDFGDQRLRVIP